MKRKHSIFDKFDRSICENCEMFWGITSGPRCHVKGKHIYEGECIEYRPKYEESEHDAMVREYEEYQDEWN